jgi:uncharacterized protein YkwD
LEERETRQDAKGEATGAREERRRLPLAVTAAGLALAALTVFHGLALKRAADAYTQENGTEGSPSSTRVKTCDGKEAELSEEEVRMVELHNEAREKEGLEYLCVEPRLAEAAQGHADDMIERDYFDHNSPDAEGMEDRIKGAGYDGYEDAGENIAWGSGESTAPDNRFDALMKSEGHRKNIMSDAYREVGIGYAEGTLDSEGDAGVYVVDFGSMGADAPHERPDEVPAGGTTGGSTTPIGGTIPDAEEPETTGLEETMPEETTGPGETVPEQPEGEDPGTPGGDTGGGTQIMTNDTGDGGDGENPSGDGLSLAEKMICKTFGDVRKGWVDETGSDFLNPDYCGFDEGGKEKGSDESPEPEADEPEGTNPEETVPQEETSPEETTAPEEDTGGGEEPPAEQPTEGAGVR